MDRDNHAGKVNDLSYIGGFFDGEGYIGMGMQKTHGGVDRNILPTVRISNTDPRPLQYIKKALDSFGIKCWLSCRAGEKRKNLIRKNGSYVKDIYDIGLSGKIQVKLFIEKIRPYIFCKGDQMDIVMEFILSREKALEGRGSRKGKGKAEYSQYEISLIDKLKKLKH